jgi:VWFA-related protein
MQKRTFRTQRQAVLSLLVCAPLLCQPAGQPTRLVIRTNVHVVEVSIVATKAGGAPAGDLSAADFRAWDNGEEQTVTRLERLSSRAVAGRAELPSDTYSNRIGNTGRPQVLSMVLLDAVNTKYRNQTVARRAVADILEQIQPEDRVAIYAFGSYLRIIHDFSSNKESLLARLRAYHGEVPDSDDLLEDLDLPSRVPPPPLQKAYFDAGRIVNTLEALEAIANHVKGVPGRKNLLWVSAAFPVTVGDPGRTASPARGATMPPPWQTFDPRMKRAMAALNDANISVYPIDARGLSINPRAAINVGTMMEIADATGGKAYYNRNDLPRGVHLALEDSRETYLMTYSPQSLLQDGAYHRIRLQSTRRGVQLRYRRGYYAPGREGDGGVEQVDRLTRVADSPLDASEIGIQAKIEIGSGASDEIALAIQVDVADLNLTPSASWTGALRLEAIQIGATGERLGGITQTAELNLGPATYQHALEQGITFNMKLRREPRAIAVRIAVVDERGGHAGSLSVALPPR